MKPRVAQACFMLGVTLGMSAAPAFTAELPTMLAETGEYRASSDGTPHPVLRPAGPSNALQAVRAQLEDPFGVLVRRLDDLAREIGRAGGTGRGNDAPSYLLLSEEDGGFARFGFWIADRAGEKEVEFCACHYVVMTVDDASLNDGRFLEVYAHELGHVMLRRLRGPWPAGMSRTYHSSLTITDYPTALDEGFAIHLQAVAGRLAALPGLQGRISGLAGEDDLVALWHGRRDQWLRVAGVRGNLFVWEKLEDPAFSGAATEGAAFSSMNRAAGVELSPAFSPVRLRSGQQMMASEGVVATLLYRLASLLRKPERPEPEALLEAYRTIFEALVRMPLRADTPLAAALFSELASTHEGEARRLYRMFVATTFGATVATEHTVQAEALAVAGMLGQIEPFAERLGAARRSQATRVDSLVAGRNRLTDAIGPELWLANLGHKLAAAPWISERTLPATVNLNTAHEAEIGTRLSLPAEAAHALYEARRRVGSFASLDEAIELSNVSAPTAERLRAQARAAAALPPYQRE